MTELAAALQAKSAADRWRALVQLNRAGSRSTDPNILSELVKALGDEHAFVRWQAGLALVGQANGRQKLVDLLKNYPAPPPEFTSGEADFKTELLYAAAVDALADKKATEATEYLTQLLAGAQPSVRRSAIEALIKQGRPDVTGSLIEALGDSDPWVRRTAAIGLGHLGDAGAAAVLISCLKDKVVIVRRSATYALGALRAEAAVPALKISLTDPDAQVRRNAAWALGRIGRSDVVPDLTRLLDDTGLNGAVAAAASEAIATLSKPRWRQLITGLGHRFKR